MFNLVVECEIKFIIDEDLMELNKQIEMIAADVWVGAEQLTKQGGNWKTFYSGKCRSAYVNP